MRKWRDQAGMHNLVRKSRKCNPLCKDEKSSICNIRLHLCAADRRAEEQLTSNTTPEDQIRCKCKSAKLYPAPRRCVAINALVYLGELSDP